MHCHLLRHVGRATLTSLQSLAACRDTCGGLGAFHRSCMFSALHRAPAAGPSTYQCRLNSSAQQNGSVSLYSDPELYDSVFSTRDFAEEADFLVEIFESHCGRRPETFLELGCGPARHSLQLAQRGLSGHAVDDSPAMVAHAAAAAKAAGAAVECVLGDMRRLQAPAAHADVAFLLCGTVSHLLTNSDVAACFASVSERLRPGGLFVLEMLHPEDLFGGSVEIGDIWEVEDPERGTLVMNYGADDGSDAFDPLSQTLARTVTVTATKDGSAHTLLSRDTVRQRLFTSFEIQLLGQAAGLSVVAQHGALALPFKSVTDEDSYALVLVLQKQ